MVKEKKKPAVRKKPAVKKIAVKAKKAVVRSSKAAVRPAVKKAAGKVLSAAVKAKKPPVEKIKRAVSVKKRPVVKKAEEIKKTPPFVSVLPAEPKELKPAPKPAPKPVPPPPAEPKPAPAPEPAPVLKELEMRLPVTVKELAVKLQEKPSIIIKRLMAGGVMAGINQSLEEDRAAKICQQYGFIIKKALDQEDQILGAHQEEDQEKALQPRWPVVTFMGHVDHGKTSLLDAIRKTNVTGSEHGGITQHIGAYRVVLPDGEITFLDTPGHEAFTAMRARGASVTDIVVLVVAADDGIMPQTEEAIDHARAAGVPIIVAINKIDKPQVDIDRVKKQLAEFDLAAEDWGGKTITVPVSAKTGQGVNDLLEMILLEAQMLELKCNPVRLGRGVVIEAKLSKGRGSVATLLIQNGTLHLNENIIVGNFHGKIRAMFDDHGRSVTKASPAFPVEVMGVNGVPQAGEQFFVIENEKQAKALADMRAEKEKQRQLKSAKKVSLEELYSQIKEGEIKELKLVVKADVQGSLGAVKDTLAKLNLQEIKLDIIHTGIGAINSSDAVLAVASNALIVGFNVSADERARAIAGKEGIEIKNYHVIYELVNDIKAAVEGMLEPEIKKVFLGRAQIRKVLRLSRSGTVAGCFVVKGKINRSGKVNLVRNGQVVFEGRISSLKRFKDDVKEVAEGFECGITLAGFDQILEGDIIEAYDIEKIARKL